MASQPRRWFLRYTTLTFFDHVQVQELPVVNVFGNGIQVFRIDVGQLRLVLQVVEDNFIDLEVGESMRTSQFEHLAPGIIQFQCIQNACSNIQHTNWLLLG